MSVVEIIRDLLPCVDCYLCLVRCGGGHCDSNTNRILKPNDVCKEQHFGQH